MVAISPPQTGLESLRALQVVLAAVVEARKGSETDRILASAAAEDLRKGNFEVAMEIATALLPKSLHLEPLV